MARRSGINGRQIISASILLGSSIALGKSQARSISGEVPGQPNQASKPPALEPGPAHFFTPDEGEFIDAAVSRLIPKEV